MKVVQGTTGRSVLRSGLQDLRRAADETDLLFNRLQEPRRTSCLSHFGLHFKSASHVLPIDNNSLCEIIFVFGVSNKMTFVWLTHLPFTKDISTLAATLRKTRGSRGSVLEWRQRGSDLEQHPDRLWWNVVFISFSQNELLFLLGLIRLLLSGTRIQEEVTTRG